MIDEDDNKRCDAMKVQFSWTLRPLARATDHAVIKFHPDCFKKKKKKSNALDTTVVILLLKVYYCISVNQLNASLDKLFFVCLFV